MKTFFDPILNKLRAKDHVDGATEGNFAGLDGEGNVIDSGSKAADFATADHLHDDRYSQLGHDHDTAYSPLGHNHDGEYAGINHDHDGVYQPAGSYASADHNHDGRYLTQHQDISGKQDKTDNTLSTTDKTVIGAINELWSKFTDYLKGISHVTHAQLLALANNDELEPGRLYRITDFVTTVANQSEARSAGHAFDLLVRAIDSSNISEIVVAALRHSGDTYYTDEFLAGLSIKYSLVNNNLRFSWADLANGKGVIYYMKDARNNCCGYDFTNVQFKRYAIDDISSTSLTAEALTELKSIYCYGQNGGKHFATKDVYGNMIPADNNGTTYDIDDTNYGWYYTFHGISSDDGETIGDHYDISTHPFKLTDECIQAQIDDDCGLDCEDQCHDNVILPAFWEYVADDEYYKGRQVLNNIVFINGLSYCYYDEDGESWSYQTSYCYGNSFGVECKYSTFGNYFQYNTFGNSCYNNTFGNSCYNNTFGNYVRYLTVFNNIQYVAVTGGSSDYSYVQNAQILNGTSGVGENNRLAISFVEGCNYTQIAGLDSNNVLKIWVPADAA